MSATQAIEIPALAKDEKVESWSKKYTAATALLSGEQKLTLFPVYAGKNASEGEKAMIEIAAKKQNIKEALDELEILRDGEPHQLVLLQRYDKVQLSQSDYKSFFFELIHKGRQADVNAHMIMLRYLSVCPRGRKLFDDNKADIKEGMTEDQAITLYKKIAPKIKQEPVNVTVKEEKSDFVFAASDEPPQWARKLTEQVSEVQKSIEGRKSHYSNSDEEDYENDCYFANKRFRGQGKSKGVMVCRSCNKPGHKAVDCFSKCLRCQGSGHSLKVCPTPERGSRNSNSQGTFSQRPSKGPR